MAVLRGAGDSKTPFYFMLLSVGIDIALNPLFIFGLGPVPRLGIAGSALATFVAQAVSLAALIRHLYRRRHVLCLHQDELATAASIDWSVVGTLVRKGIPMSAQMLVMSLERRAHDHARQPLRRRHHRGLRRGAADLELHPDAGLRGRSWPYRPWPRRTSAPASGIASTAHREHRRALQRAASPARSIIVLELLGCAYLLACSCRRAPRRSRIASHLNHIVTPSFMFFGDLGGAVRVVRATGAVMRR